MDAPPETERGTVVETRHGEEIPDPYRWLEGDDDAVAEWVAAQNDYADEFLRGERREALRPRFEPLAGVADYQTVLPRGDYYFQRVEGEADDHPALTVRASLSDERRTLADPNEWDGPKSLDWYVPRRDGAYVAYGVAEGGDEQYDVHVLDVDTGETVDVVRDAGRVNAFHFAWAPDGDGYYYGRTGGADEGAQHEKEICHRTFEGDETVLMEHDDPHEWPVLWTDEATGTLVLGLSELSGATDLYVHADGEFVPALTGVDAEFDVTLHDGRAYLRTEYGAPKGRLLACDVADLRAGVDPDDLAVVVPEWEETLEEVAVGGGRVVATYQRGGSEHVAAFTLDGDHLGGVPVPEHAAVSGLAVHPDRPEAFFRQHTFAAPPTVQRADLEALAAETVDEPALDAAADLDLTVERTRVESTDGARVPVYLVHRPGIDLDGDNPALLYGYGGFRINVTAESASRFLRPFLADGGVYAQVCARGGREFGERWHEGAMGEHKQHTFDDFVAAAEHLVDAGYTSPDRLAVAGGSNGGLSASALLTQRPDLFAAVRPAVPLTDMLRFHEFLIGASWTTEYGDPDDPGDFEHLRAYSPYHNVDGDVEYPPTLFKTAVSDTRVHPAHARKMVARLQSEAAGGPFLLRTDDDTGHGLGKPTSQVLAEQLDEWTFFYEFLGVEP